MKTTRLIHLWAALLSVAFTLQLHAQSGAFTYQGSLSDNGSPATGIYDLRFTIYDVETNGVAIDVVTNAATEVVGGLFTVTLDFGAGVFDGDDRWLEIGATTNGGGGFNALSPRQPITSTPYAVRAESAGTAVVADTVTGSVAAAQLTGTVSSSQLADDSVTSAKIADGTIATADIANNSVTSAKIPDATITSADLATDSVGASEIAANAVGTSEIADGSVTSAKIGGVLLSSQIPDLVAAKITSGTLDDARLSANVALLDATQTFAGTNSFPGSANTFSGNFVGNGVGLTNVPGAIPSQTTLGTSVQAFANMAYVATNSEQVTFTLPSDANIGDVVQVSGLGTGGWQLDPNAGQYINGYQTGAVWIAREEDRQWTSEASSADGSSLVAVVAGGQIHTSTDGGRTWTDRESSRNWIAVASSADGTVLAAAVNGGQIYISSDRGTNWIARAFSDAWYSIASSADGTRMVAVIYDGQIYISDNSGTNWTARASTRKWTSVASSADGLKLVAVESGETFSNGGRIYTSVNGGTNWTARESDRRWRSIASSADGTKLVAADVGQFNYDGGQIHTSTDSGTNWVSRESTRLWRGVASSADGSQLVAVVEGGRIHTSSDSGTNWTVQTASRDWWSVASSDDGGKLVAVVSGGQVYTSIPGLEGTQGSVAQLQYSGDGLWQMVSQPESSPNTPYTTVTRDGSGGFAAGVISATAFQGNGSGLTSLNAAQLTSGTINDGRLSANVAKLGSSQTFTGANVFNNVQGSFTGVFVGDGSGLTGLPNGSALDASDGSPANALFVDADGDVGIGTTTPSGDLQIQTPNNVDASFQMRSGTGWTLVMNQSPNSVFSITNGGQERLTIEPGGNIGIGTNNPSQKLHVVGNILATGTVTGSSDRNVKENFAPLDAQEVLAKVAAMPIQRWNYIGEDTPHLGPVAQDFYRAFQVGMDNKHISMVDADGVALAAIQGLNLKLEQKETEITELKSRLTALENLIANLNLKGN